MSEKRHQQKLYRIVGIRRNESREVLRSGLSREQATALFLTLMNSEEFTGFAVERDPHQPAARHEVFAHTGT
ncbi:MAG: hypothetical protein HY290_29390 [Planctomycetia bacterium]|nr:hypothetical protein [Planctomycetia bacterium]